MKKYLSLVLVMLCILSLCACTEKQDAPAQTVTPAPVAETSPAVAETSEVQAATPIPDVSDVSLLEKAQKLEGESVDDLIAAVGEPLSREEYAPSCLGDGEDGIWHYSGFDVYTYRENGKESVYAVLPS